MSPSSVVIRIQAPGLHPDTMKASDLAQVLTLLEKAIEAAAGVRPAEDDDAPVIVSLTGMRDGSACPAFTVSPTAWDGLGAICRSVADRDFDRLPRAAQARLADLSRLFVGRGWVGTFVGRDLPPAAISAANPVPEPAPARARGATTLVGQCVRLGGVQPGVQIRPVKGGKLVAVQAPKELVKELGDRVYETVALEGEAVWDAESWDVLEFRATRVIPYRPADPRSAFRELAAAAGGVWDGVVVEDYVRASRSEEGGGP